MTPSDYPKRPKFFAHRFTRLMGKVCLGNDIGAECCWLLAFIAHTEDAKGYRAAVTFFNCDLATRCGFSLSAMKRARAKAVKAGWLNYTEGAKGRAARYFVTVPKEFDGFNDGAGDEDERGFSSEIVGQIDPESGQHPDVIRPESGQQPVSIRSESGPPSSLSQDFLSHPQEGAGADGDEEPGPTRVGPAPKIVEAHWNACPGLLPCVGSDPNRSRIIRTWATQNSLWVEHWRPAIEFMGRTALYCGSGGSGWRADLGWVFKDSNFLKVVEQMLAERARSPANGFRPVVIFGTQPPREKT